MKLTITALALLLPALAVAAPAAERRPEIATMEGGFSGRPARLTLLRREWRIAGEINGQEVKVAIDNEAKTVTGSANGQPVALTFDATPERTSYKGAVNGSTIEYSIDWQAGVIDGAANGSKLHLEFNLDGGTVDRKKSALNGAPVGLTLEAASGRLSGTIGGKDIGLTLTDADLADFLENLYLFVKP
ncbi:MAG: hypothetical protein ACHQ2Z_01290 [Elusimicrobiota bacterium]